MKISQSPCYIFDLSAMKRKMQEFAQLFESYNAQFLFPVKSFPHPTVLKLAIKVLGGVEISNQNEASLIKGMGAKHLFLNSPLILNSLKFLSDRDISNKYFAISSFEQREKLQSVSGIKYALRFRGPSQSRFGFEVNKLKKPDFEINGLSFHQSFSEDAVLASVYFAKLAVNLEKKWKLDTECYNFGGGFHGLTIREAERMLKALRLKCGRDKKFYFEPGRFWSEEFGSIIGNVQNLNSYKKEGQLVVDISKECHLRWSQVTRPGSGKTFPIYGATCSESDLIGKFGASKINKKIRFSNVSGYSWAWQTQFNGITEIPIFFV